MAYAGLSTLIRVGGRMDIVWSCWRLSDVAPVGCMGLPSCSSEVAANQTLNAFLSFGSVESLYDS